MVSDVPVPAPLFERLTATVLQVPLAEIADVGPGPRGSTGAAIRALGFTSAVLLKLNDDLDNAPVREVDGREYVVRYTVVDGRRRVRDAIEAGVDSIPAVVVPSDAGPDEVAALQVSMNLNRAPNAMEEAESLSALREAAVRSGVRYEDAPAYISRALGLSRAVVEQRLRLSELPAPVRKAASDGRVVATVAAKLANLPEAERAELIGRLEDGERVTARDVAEARQVKQEQSLAQLPFDLFDEGAAMAAAAGSMDWPKMLADAVSGLVAAGNTADDVLAMVEAALEVAS